MENNRGLIALVQEPGKVFKKAKKMVINLENSINELLKIY
jgi:hypothetical protein